MNAKLSKVNQSIEKTIQIVEVMARGKGPMRLQDVAKKCGMPASTVMRMLNTLQVYGYVNQDPCTQHYSLSLRFARLGCLVSEQTNMRDVARPFLASWRSAVRRLCACGVRQKWKWSAPMWWTARTES